MKRMLSLHRMYVRHSMLKQFSMGGYFMHIQGKGKFE